MKKKIAVVLSVILACSMSMTAMAAPSPSIVNEPVTQVVVSSSIGTEGTATVSAVSSETSAVLPGTTFVTAGGQVIDQAAVALVAMPSIADQAHAAAASLVSALASKRMQVINFTGRDVLYLTDLKETLKIVNHMTVGLQTATGEAVSQNGSVSVAFPLKDILGGATMTDGETVQALYQRADGTWVAVPVVIINGAVAIALPAFGGAINVTFIVAKGDQLQTIPVKRSPRT